MQYLYKHIRLNKKTEFAIILKKGKCAYICTAYVTNKYISIFYYENRTGYRTTMSLCIHCFVADLPTRIEPMSKTYK